MIPITTLSCFLRSFFLLLCALHTAPILSQAADVEKQLVSGKIVGFEQDVGGKTVETFLGVPFAQKPLGELRFKNPLAVANWTGTIDTKVNKPACAQKDYLDKDKFPNPADQIWYSTRKSSEDCLYLNVWAPKASPPSSDLRPVLVWIYGGGFWSGSIDLEVYDGKYLAASDIIVVSIQYRVGPFGFLYTGTADAPGNQGIMDQILGLKWVRDNISKFNGDPAKVTVYGESAGAVSTIILATSPLSSNLVHQFILGSASYLLTDWAASSPSVASSVSTHFMSHLGCTNSMACMRAVSMQKVVDAATGPQNEYIKAVRSNRLNKTQNVNSLDTLRGLYAAFGPIFNTPLLPKKPSEHLKSVLKSRGSSFPKSMMGFMANEGMYWILYAPAKKVTYTSDFKTYSIPPQLTSGGSVDAFNYIQENILPMAFFNNSVTKMVLREYDVPSKRIGSTAWTAQQVTEKFDQILGDTSFTCPVILTANMVAQLSPSADVYLYHFTHRTASLPFPVWTGAMHGYELDYVFGTPQNEDFGKRFYAFSDQEKALSQSVMRYWINFIKTGNPNTGQPVTAQWPKFDLEKRQSLELRVAPMKSETFQKQLKCGFWSTIDTLN